jgi:hypothetical protein
MSSISAKLRPEQVYKQLKDVPWCGSMGGTI